MLKQYRVFILTAALFVVATLGLLTWRQSAMYGDIETLWRITLKRNPECWMAHTNLGIVLLQKGQLDDGIAQYRAALQMQPDSWDAEYNLGTALVTKGEVDEAILHCERAVAMQPNDPDSQVSLGNALLQKQRIDEAIVHYQSALAIRPDYFLAHYGLGRAFLEKGEADTAIQHCRTALLIRPDDADCHTVLAVALDEKGETAEAIHHYEKALVIFPKSISALTNVAWLRATSSTEGLRNGDEAVKLAGQANELSGGTNAVVLRTLAAAYAETGQFGKAIESGRTALQLARVHGDQSLAVELEQQIAVYELRLPYRETRK
jgi:tetratricopeptide (TPR) repeat protein